MNKFFLMFVGAIAMFTMACGVEQSGVSTSLDYDAYAEMSDELAGPMQANTGEVTVTSGYIQSDDFEVFNQEATVLQVIETPYLTFIDVITELDDGAVMGRVSFDAEPINLMENLSEDLTITGRYCSGDQVNVWDTDYRATNTVITQEFTDDGVRIHFDMNFNTLQSDMSGYFDLIFSE